jgi:hypothetical protein
VGVGVQKFFWRIYIGYRNYIVRSDISAEEKSINILEFQEFHDPSSNPNKKEGICAGGNKPGDAAVAGCG